METTPRDNYVFTTYQIKSIVWQMLVLICFMWLVMATSIVQVLHGTDLAVAFLVILGVGIVANLIEAFFMLVLMIRFISEGRLNGEEDGEDQ